MANMVREPRSRHRELKTTNGHSGKSSSLEPCLPPALVQNHIRIAHSAEQLFIVAVESICCPGKDVSRLMP